MNQNNNINFDPMTGQQIPNQVPNKNNNFNIKLIAIIVGAMIISGGIFFIMTRENKLDNNSNQTIQDNNSTNQNQTTDNNSNNNNSNNNNDNNNNSSDTLAPVTPADPNAFLMPIESVSTKNGKTMVLGDIMRGKIKVGDTIQIVGSNAEPIETIVDGLTLFGKDYTEANTGERINIILHDADRETVEKCQVVAKPDSIKAVKSFEANVYVYSKEEGGRSSAIDSSYQPKFNFYNSDVMGNIEFLNGVKKANPGDTVKLKITLDDYVAMEVGTKFEIHEGDKQIVANGTVTKIN